MKKTTKLTKRLAQYGALTAIVAGAADANGQVVYTDESPDFAGGIGDQYFLDVNNDGNDDFRIWHNGSSNLYVSPLTSTNGVLGSGGSTFAYPFALTSGATVSSGAGTFFNNGFSGGFQSLNYGSCSFGNWCSVTDRYMGLEFNIGPDTHYGWVRLDVDQAGDVWSVEEFAYDATPGAPVTTGDMGVVGNAPVISCPMVAPVDNDAGECGAVVNFSDATAVDIEDGVLTAVQTI